MRRAQRGLLARPRTTLAAAATLVVLSLVPASRLRTLIVIDDLIDPDFKTYTSMENLRKEFPNKNNLLLLVKRRTAGEVPTSSELCDLLGWMNQAAHEVAGVEKIFSSFGVRVASDRDSSVRLTPLLRKDCGTYGSDAEEAPTVRAEMTRLSASAFGPYLSSRKSDDVLLTFYLRDQEGAARFGHFNYGLVDQLRNHFETHFVGSHPEMKGVWGGMGMYQYFLKIGYDQSVVLNGIAALVMIVLFRLIYGTWISALLFEATLIFSLAIVYGVMGLLDWPIDNLSNVLPTLLMVATLEDFVFLSFFRKASGKNTASAVRKLAMPCFFTSLTTAIGFGSLGTSDLSIVRRFGAECAIGSMLEWIAVIALVPALVSVFPKLAYWVKPGRNFMERIATQMNPWRAPRWVAYLFLSVLPFSMLFYSKLNVNDSPEEIFSASHPFAKAMDYLRESRGWTSEVSLVFKDFTDESANREILRKIRETDPLVAAVEDPYAVRDAITSGVSERHRPMFNSLWKDSPYAARLVSSRTDQARALLFLKSTDIVHVNALRARIEGVCGERCTLAGSLNSYGEFGEKVLNTLLASLGSSLFQVGLVLFLLCVARRQARSFFLVLCSMWGVFALLSLYIVFQFKVFFITSVVASIMVGLAGDSPIQFLFSKTRERSVTSGIKRLSPAAFTVTFLMSITMSVLFFSGFRFIRDLAGLMILGLFLLYFGDVFLLKSVLGERDSD